MYKLFHSNSFEKKLDKYLKKYKGNHGSVQEVFLKLQNDPFDKSLKTHKLKGLDTYSCNINYSHRLLFEIEENKIIILESIGDHESGY
jgi:addiction module RelE/StbE family toxin